jgi:hypothetical protein
MDSADDQILSQINRLMSDERDASNSEDDFSNQQWAIQVHAWKRRTTLILRADNAYGY